MPPRRQAAAPAVDPRIHPRPEEPVVDPAAPPVVHRGEENLHHFLRFTREEDRVDRDRLLARAAAHGYDELRYISWESLISVQLHDRASTTCGPYWRRLFSITDPCCEELAIEFFSTFHLITPLVDYAREDALSFRLGGIERHMSLRRFAVLMGLYTEQELDTPAFTGGLTDWPEGVTAHSFWQEIGTGPYTVPTLPKSTKIRDPLHRLLHRAIAHTLTSHGESSGSVTLTDLFYLYCIVSGRPCQIAERLARFLYMIRQSRVTMAIYGGGYVYRLARALQIMPLQELEALTFSAFAVAIDTNTMIRMQMVRRDGRRHILLGGDRQDWIPPREGEEQHAPEQHAPEQHAPEQPAPQQSPRRDPPPTRQEPHLVYHRTYSTQVRRLQAEVSELRDTTRAEIARITQMVHSEMADIREIQRLEYEHAEAHRQHTSRMLQILARGSSEPFPDPPARPQRLLDLLAGASSSGTTRQ